MEENPKRKSTARRKSDAQPSSGHKSQATSPIRMHLHSLSCYLSRQSQLQSETAPAPVEPKQVDESAQQRVQYFSTASITSRLGKTADDFRQRVLSQADAISRSQRTQEFARSLKEFIPRLKAQLQELYVAVPRPGSSQERATSVSNGSGETSSTPPEESQAPKPGYDLASGSGVTSSEPAQESQAPKPGYDPIKVINIDCVTVGQPGLPLEEVWAWGGSITGEVARCVRQRWDALRGPEVAASSHVRCTCRNPDVVRTLDEAVVRLRGVKTTGQRPEERALTSGGEGSGATSPEYAETDDDSSSYSSATTPTTVINVWSPLTDSDIEYMEDLSDDEDGVQDDDQDDDMGETSRGLKRGRHSPSD